MEDVVDSRALEWWMRSVAALLKGRQPGTLPDDKVMARMEIVTQLIRQAIDLNLECAHRLKHLEKRFQALFEKYDKGQGGSESGRKPVREDSEGHRPEGAIAFVMGDAGPCGRCGRSTARGLVGWQKGEDPGALCIACLAGSNLDLAATLAMFGFLRQCARQEFASNSEEIEAGAALLEMARDYAQATAGTWPVRPTGALEMLEKAHKMMEERHGLFWLSELVRRAGDEGEPS